MEVAAGHAHDLAPGTPKSRVASRSDIAVPAVIVFQTGGGPRQASTTIAMGASNPFVFFAAGRQVLDLQPNPPATAHTPHPKIWGAQRPTPFCAFCEQFSCDQDKMVDGATIIADQLGVGVRLQE
jgi:hypothetical protein